MKTEVAARRAEVVRFRKRLRAGMMLVVLASTGLVLWYAHRRLAEEARQSDRLEFQSRLELVLSSQKAHREAAAQKCRELAASVRIRAALEEGDVEDLYENAKVELRDVLAPSLPAAPATGAMLRVDFYCFFDRQGALLPEPGRGASAVEWERQLTFNGGALQNQSLGYLAAKANGKTVLREVIATPLLATESGEVIGAIVLGFVPFQNAWETDSPGIHNGLWLADHLEIPSLSPPASAEAAAQIRPILEQSAEAQESIAIRIEGEPYLLFHRRLNPGSSFPAAWQLFIYPLREMLVRERELRFKILIAGALIAAAALAASHFLAHRMAAPVSRLADDSIAHRERSALAEAERDASEQKYRAIFENAAEGIFVRSLNGRYLEANPALARIFGFADAGAFCAGFRESAEPSLMEEEDHREMTARRCDGHTIWISRRTRAIRGAGGEVIHYEGSVVDITERKRAADEMLGLNAELEVALTNLRGTQQQVIQQERLRALGEMASGIAHDFNNTLVPILGFCELLLLDPESLSEPGKVVPYLEIIQTAAKDAAGVVTRLREFYRSDKGDDPFAPVDLRELVNQAVTLTQPKWKDQALTRGATVRVALDLAAVPLISGHDSALREALTNLIFNAVDAMPAGGTLTLRTREKAGKAVLEISDTGLGMTEEVRQRCLEPFFSTKGDRGTGLGLAMVFGIVKRHEGELELQSKPGEGATFTLTFPRDVSSPSIGVRELRPALLRSLRVLVVDDDGLVRDTLSAVLSADNHNVTLAHDGADGLKRFVAGVFDLVITDKAMPNLSGDQMAKAIKRVSPRTPVILLTGFGMFHDKSEFPGVDFLAAKPVRIPALREAIAFAMNVDPLA